MKQWLSDGFDFFKTNVAFCLVVTIATFALSAATNVIPYAGFIVSWILGLYVSTGWIITYRKSKEGTAPTFEVFIDSCKETTPILGKLIISQMYVHFLGMLMFLVLAGATLYYMLFEGPQLLNVVTQATSFDLDLWTQINTRMTAYSHNFTKNDFIFGASLFLISVILLAFYSLASQLLTAVVINEKQSPFKNFQTTFKLIAKGGWSLFFRYLLLGVVVMTATFVTCFLGMLVLMPIMWILPQILYRDLSLPQTPQSASVS